MFQNGKKPPFGRKNKFKSLIFISNISKIFVRRILQFFFFNNDT